MGITRLKRNVGTRITVPLLGGAICLLSILGCALIEPKDEGSSLVMGRVSVKEVNRSKADTIHIRVENEDGSLSYIATADSRGYFFIPNVPSGIGFRLSRIDFEQDDSRFKYEMKKSEVIGVDRGVVKDLGHYRVNYGSKDGVSVRLSLSLGSKTRLSSSVTLGFDISASVPLVPPRYETAEEVIFDETASLQYLIGKYPQSPWARRAEVQLESFGSKDD